MKTGCSTLTALCHRIACESAPLSRLREFSHEIFSCWEVPGACAILVRAKQDIRVAGLLRGVPQKTLRAC